MSTLQHDGRWAAGKCRPSHAYVVITQCNNMLHSGRHSIKHSMQRVGIVQVGVKLGLNPNLFQLCLLLFCVFAYRQLVQIEIHTSPKILNG